MAGTAPAVFCSVIRSLRGCKHSQESVIQYVKHPSNVAFFFSDLFCRMRKLGDFMTSICLGMKYGSTTWKLEDGTVNN